jgi:hypothetical protein
VLTGEGDERGPALVGVATQAGAVRTTLRTPLVWALAAGIPLGVAAGTDYYQHAPVATLACSGPVAGVMDGWMARPDFTPEGCARVVSLPVLGGVSSGVVMAMLGAVVCAALVFLGSWAAAAVLCPRKGARDR